MSLAKSVEDITPSREEVYQAFLRSLRRRKGFGIVFVQSSPAEATRLIQRVRRDLSQKQISVLQLTESIDNLYEIVERHPKRNSLNILFIRGLENSLEPYIELGYGGEGGYYTLETVPRILSHLNQQRENFRDNFSNICFVFILPLFGIKYFIRRAPDFFDWSAGVFEFPAVEVSPHLELQQIYPDRLSWEDLENLTFQEREERIRMIQSLLKNTDLTSEQKAKLFFEKGKLLQVTGNYESAIAEYDCSLNIQPDNCFAWNNRGNALSALGQYQEAVKSYDRAIEKHPKSSVFWNNRSIALKNLGLYEEAILSYEQALSIDPTSSNTWNNKGLVLAHSGKLEEARRSFEEAVSLEVDFAWAWSNRGLSLTYLGEYESAISSFNRALEIQPTNTEFIYNRACCHALSGNADLAIADLESAIRVNPSKYLPLVKTDEDFDGIRENQKFKDTIDNNCD